MNKKYIVIAFTAIIFIAFISTNVIAENEDVVVNTSTQSETFIVVAGSDECATKDRLLCSYSHQDVTYKEYFEGVIEVAAKHGMDHFTSFDQFRKENGFVGDNSVKETDILKAYTSVGYGYIPEDVIENMKSN